MKERVRRLLMLTGIMCAMCLSLCACGDGGNASSDEHEDVQGYSNEEMKKFPSKEEQEYIERETKKMKEEGILDENGQPLPGVDLNDYPGLG